MQPDALEKFIECPGPMTDCFVSEGNKCDLCKTTVAAIEIEHSGWTLNKEEIPKWIGIDEHGRPTLYENTRSTAVGNFSVYYGKRGMIQGGCTYIQDANLVIMADMGIIEARSNRCSEESKSLA